MSHLSGSTGVSATFGASYPTCEEMGLGRRQQMLLFTHWGEQRPFLAGEPFSSNLNNICFSTRVLQRQLELLFNPSTIMAVMCFFTPLS